MVNWRKEEWQWGQTMGQIENRDLGSKLLLRAWEEQWAGTNDKLVGSFFEKGS